MAPDISPDFTWTALQGPLGSFASATAKDMAKYDRTFFFDQLALGNELCEPSCSTE